MHNLDISWQVSVAEQACFEPYLVKKWKQGYSGQYPYSKTCVKHSLSKSPKIGFQDQVSLNAGQKYCRMLQGILQYFRPSLSYHLPFVLSIFEWTFYTGFTVCLLKLL